MDIRNILNADGAQARSAESITSLAFPRSPQNLQGPPGAKNSRAHTTFNEPQTIQNQLPKQSQSPQPSSSGYGSPEFQRQSLPPQLHSKSSFHTTAEMHRDSVTSSTSTTTQPIPDFSRNILNGEDGIKALSDMHSSPAESKSSTPGAMPKHSSRMAGIHADAPTKIPTAAVEVTLSGLPRRKRGADDTLHPRTPIKRARTNQEEPLESAKVPAQLAPRGSPQVRRSESSSTAGKGDLVTHSEAMKGSREEQKRASTPPIWATRSHLGRKRFVTGNLAQRYANIPARGPSPNSHTPSTTQPRTSHPAHQVQAPPREPNLTGRGLPSGISRTISEWLWSNVISQDQFPTDGPNAAAWEVEAKLGVIVDNGTGLRFSNGSLTEAVLGPDVHDVRFESGVSLEDFRHLNDFLNAEVKQSGRPGRFPIHYSHPRDRDHFLPLDPAGREQLLPVFQHYLSQASRPPKLRVSTDTKNNGQITDKIVKARMSDLHIFCPQNKFDIRISVSLEIRWNGHVEINGQHSSEARDKDRLRYKHQASIVDITQVRSRGAVTQEVEVELDVAFLQADAAKLEREGTAPFEATVMQLVENTMVLNRAAAQDPNPGTVR